MKTISVLPKLDFDEKRERFDSPAGIVECEAEIDGAMRTWKEYIPSSYDGIKAVPLVFTLHGGSTKPGTDHHGAHLSTSWALLAEREGFIVVYPQSLTPDHTWSAWEDFKNDPERTAELKDDILYLNLLLELICSKYKIDRTRMYLHGQSFGDVMSTFYLLNNPGHPFAAAATMSGPVGADRLFREDGSFVFGTECATPVIRTHGSTDLAMPLGTYQHMEDTIPTFDLMRYMKKDNASFEELTQKKFDLHMLPLIHAWKHCNSCEALPELSVRGRYNALTWHGAQDFHFYTVEGGGHGPSMDMADFVWTYFFSGYQKVDGKYVKVQPLDTFTPDQGAVVLAENAPFAYVDNKIVKLSAPAKFENGVLCLPAAVIAEVYPELKVVISEDNLSAEITDAANRMQVSANNRTFVWNNHLKHGNRTMSDGALYVPVRQVGQYFYGQVESAANGISYISDCAGQINYDFSRLVKELLGSEEDPTEVQLYKATAAVLAGKPQPGMK